jgi:hypothetical protein
VIDVGQTEAEIERCRGDYVSVLESKLPHDLKGLTREAALDLRTSIHKAAVAWFNAFESSLELYDPLNPSVNDDYRRKKEGESINMCESIVKHWTLIRRIEQAHGLDCLAPSARAYSAIQRSVNRGASKKIRDEFIKQFDQLNIPTMPLKKGERSTGFVNPNQQFTKVQLMIGVPLLLITAVTPFVFQDLTGTQYLVVRALLALSISTVGASLIQDNLQVKWTMAKSLTIRAAGWIGVFMLLYYKNPPSAPTP